MSIWYTQAARCPGCGADLQFDLARGVHISRVPAVRAAILDRSFHRPTCDACGLRFEAAREVVYTDFGRHHWIHVAEPCSLGRWSDAERAALALFDRLFAAGPPAVAALAGRFTVRVVMDHGELRERLLAWDAGIDDALLECAKLLAIRGHLELAESDRRLRLDGIAADGGLEMVSVAGIDPAVVLARFTIPRPALDALAADRATWQDRYPALFGRGFISIDRLLRDST